jgi:hypothetical protein
MTTAIVPVHLLHWMKKFAVFILSIMKLNCSNERVKNDSYPLPFCRIFITQYFILLFPFPVFGWGL